MIDRSDPSWYKDAIIYQVHIKSFFDSNNDGIGDIQGLIAKLDYIQELGVNTIWLLPFYPSPLRDDGYDIADYRSINPSYGTMRDLRQLIAEAHKRGLRVITELVINHTSDQHPWFQRARRARPGSLYRNYYVWSDTDQKYEDTRIIFLDTETSNWSWDPAAKAYYWHRFYSHQPDLNFDNPRVLREVLNVMHFWLKMGIDGLRLDAIPYLIEREGTNCENLPETHDLLKKIRAELDAHYPDRLLLAEANQWPEDTRPYFGEGDECHMAFHFPLMPRMYMAVAQEDRHPLGDILRQTPEIPAPCQWAIFLRNHDELTLEMVTDRERDYLWNFYAADRRMRINLGIRRRLAPLLDNDRRKIELLNSMLMSMPGTPVLYYGDEIGLGDNIYLGDRDGVRTPMQWSPDRNGGFSRADPARLFLPAIMDPVYGFDAVNVEAQQRSSSSLLNWMQRLISVRQAHQAFGRGTLTLLYPANRKIFAYLREHEGETILCVVNLSRTAQAVELDLSSYKGRVPLEMLGRSPFPPIGDLPYLLTLPPYGFAWFLLTLEAELPRWHTPIPEPMPELVTLIKRDGWQSILDGPSTRALELDVLPPWLAQQRWFAAKDQGIAAAKVTGGAELPAPGGSFLLAEVEVALRSGAPAQRYLVPLAATFDEAALAHGSPLLPYTLAQVRRTNRVGAMYDALVSEDFPRAVIAAMRAGSELPAIGGRVAFFATSAMDAVTIDQATEIRRLGVEQSNSSVMLGDQAILKVYRKLLAGTHPELEIGRFLTEVGFANTPPLLGAAELIGADGGRTALLGAFGFVRHQGDGWIYTLNYLERTFEETRHLWTSAEPVTEEERDVHGIYRMFAATLGRRSAEMHRAFATPTGDPAFAAEPLEAADMQALRRGLEGQLGKAMAALDSALPGLEGDPRAEAEALLLRRGELLARIEQLTAAPVAASKTRLHGDYHLGQVLVVQDDVHIIDFEGEPARPLDERRAKTSPLKDVAGMLRSFDYAGWVLMLSVIEHGTETLAAMTPYASEWQRQTRAAFLDGYREAIGDCPSRPREEDDVDRLLAIFLLEKALYEIAYEAANRPGWLVIPLRGVTALLDGPEDDHGQG
jgi:maltose alpha-D-glucosyltransferase / alpha-amylase